MDVQAKKAINGIGKIMYKKSFIISLMLGVCASLGATTQKKPLFTQKYSGGTLELYYECSEATPEASQVITFSRAEAYLLTSEFGESPHSQSWTRDFSKHRDPIKKNIQYL